MRDKPVAGDELQKAKNQEQSSFVFGQDSIFSEALMLGTYQMLGDYRMVDRYLSGIDKVTPADIQRVAREYLVDSNRTLGVLVPTGVLPHRGGGAAGHGPISHATGAFVSGEASR